MSEMPTTLVPMIPVPTSARSTPDAAAVIETMARALSGRSVPPRKVFATGAQASTEEGLAMMQSLLTIADPAWRQALLDAAATLAAPPFA